MFWANFINFEISSYFVKLMRDEKIIRLVYDISEKNDQIAFAQLYRFFFPGLLTFANSIVKNKSLSEDIVSNVFIKIWENRKILPTIKNLSHYLYVAVKHASINSIYREKSFFFDEINEDNQLVFNHTTDTVISKENLIKITEAINLLPPKCRLIFRLIKEEGLKHAEVASLLELSESTIENQITIALRKIAECLQLELPEYQNYYKAKKR
ncbi:MAG: hypothetical protein BGN92_11795 [Sphingobacteriales bacterium 41-5]|nr:MAG: hypothetical protein BGN92_11795 [Sphingobacteriales bacterium 41-5]